MDELNEPASNFRLLQVDFYNILSPGNQLSRTDPLLSLDPLPKKSISISLEDGLQMGWAPNGYGKTFVFSTLLGLLPNNTDSSQSTIGGYQSYCERIFQKTNFREDTNEPINPDKRHLLPFSIMGLKLESKISKRTYSIAAVFQTATQANAAFTYEETPTFFIQFHPILNDIEDDDDHNPNRHWVATSLDSWVKVETPQGHEFLEAALGQLLSLQTSYVETPKMSMEAFTQRVKEYAHSFIGFEEHGIKGKHESFFVHVADSSPQQIFTISSEPKVDTQALLTNTQRSANYFFTKPQALLRALKASLIEVNDFTDALNPLDSSMEFDMSLAQIHEVLEQNEDFFDHNLIEEHSSSFLRHFSNVSRDMLFTVGEYNNEIRYELFCNVLQFVREHNFLTNTWRKRLICLLETLQLAYLSDDAICSLSFEDAKARLDALLDDIDERPNNLSYLKFRAHNVRRIQAHLNGDEAEMASCYEQIRTWIKRMFQQDDDSNVDMFPSFLEGAIIQGSQHTNMSSWDGVSLHYDIYDEIPQNGNVVRDQENFRQRMPDNWEDVLWPKSTTLDINYQFIIDSINQIINSEDDPWGVKAKFLFSAEQPIHFSPSQMPENTLLPEFLSFGMRSEIILQCALCEFIIKHRQSKTKRDSGYNFELLILDEAEVGRSEYWTQLLIGRLNRLENQLLDFKDHSVLVVSHRGLVLERSRKDGHYHVMYPLDYTEDLEI